MRQMFWSRVVLAALAAALVLPAAAQQTKPPRVPPALDPGGVAIALLSTGIDYTQADIAARLARDGEGEPIAWDFADNGNRPYLASPNGTPANWGGDGTALARVILNVREIPTRLIAVRIDPDRPAALAPAVAFIARTPAAIIVVPMWGTRADWEPFRQTAQQFPQLLFIVAAGDGNTDLDKDPVYPAAFGLDNVLVVSAVSFADRDWQFRGNWGASTVDAVAPVALLPGGPPLPPPLTGRAAALAALVAAQQIAGDVALSGSKLKEKVISAAPWQMTETPPRTRTQAVIIPVVANLDQLAPGFPAGLRPRTR